MAKSLFDIANFQPNEDGDDDEIDGYVLTSHDDDETEQHEQILTDKSRKSKTKLPATKSEVVPSLPQSNEHLPQSTTKPPTESNVPLDNSSKSLQGSSSTKAKVALPPLIQPQSLPQSQPTHTQKRASAPPTAATSQARGPQPDPKLRFRAPLAEGAQLSDVVVSLIDNQQLSNAEAEALIDMIQVMNNK